MCIFYSLLDIYVYCLTYFKVSNNNMNSRSCCSSIDDYNNGSIYLLRTFYVLDFKLGVLVYCFFM